MSSENKIACKICGIKKGLNDYYLKDRKTGRISTQCKKCFITSMGVKEPGKYELSIKLFKDGLRKCSFCKVIKNLSEFTKAKNEYGGYAHECYECSQKRVKTYRKKQKENIGFHYLNRFVIENYKAKRYQITPELIDVARAHVELKRAMKYHLDGKEFDTIRDFARYAGKKYGLKPSCIEKRIDAGHSESDSILPNSDMRSKFGNKSKGMVQVTDITTNEIKTFTTLTRAMRYFNISSDVANRCISTGCIRKPYNNSTNKQILKFEYYGE